MAHFRLSGPAKADLAAILDTSQDRWGEAARTRYAALLEAAMQSIAADPEGPLTRARAEISPGVRSFHVRHARRARGVKSPVHVIIFQINRSGMIEILRILHENMEPGRHIMSPFR